MKHILCGKGHHEIDLHMVSKAEVDRELRHLLRQLVPLLVVVLDLV